VAKKQSYLLYIKSLKTYIENGGGTFPTVIGFLTAKNKLKLKTSFF
jgi:hypothetical protein